MGVGASLDKKIYSFFKKGVFDGALSILGALQFDGNLRVAYTSVTGTALYINKAANTGPTIKAHCHQLAASSTVVGDQVVANEFKGEFLDTIGTMDGVASHFHMNASGTGIMRAILGVAYLDLGKTMSGTNFATQSWMVGGLFSANVAGILNGAGVCIAGLYGGIGSCVGSTLTAAKYVASIWADSSRLVALSSGLTALILATNQAGAAAVSRGIKIEANGSIGVGLEMSGTYTGGTMKIHCHQMAAVASDVFANEFKGEFLNTGAYVMDGIAAHYHMAANNTGVLRSVIGVAYLDAGITLSGALATGSMIAGGVFACGLASTSVLDGAAVIATGLYAEISSTNTPAPGSVLTAVKHVSALQACTKLLITPASGLASILLLQQFSGAVTIPQAIYLEGAGTVKAFATFDVAADDAAIEVSTSNMGANATSYAIKVKIGSIEGWIPVFDTHAWT